MSNNAFSGPCLYFSTNMNNGEAASDFGKNCSFSVALLESNLPVNSDQTSFKTDKLHLKFSIKLKSEELTKLLIQEDVAFFIRIVVNRTKFRIVEKLFPVEEHRTETDSIDGIYKVDVPVDSLFGLFDIEIFLAGTRVAQWQHVDIDGDTLNLLITPGRICAFGRLPERYEIQRSETHIKLMSIFSLKSVPDDLIQDGVVKCDPTEGSDKLEICIGKTYYDKLGIVAKNFPETFRDRIVLPALISVLSQVYSPSKDNYNENIVTDFQETLWLQVIETALREHKIDISKRTISDALLDAQLLLDRPALRIEDATHE